MNHGGRSRHREPDPRRQDVSNSLLDADWNQEGMILMDQYMAKLLQQKLITYETALSRAENKK